MAAGADHAGNILVVDDEEDARQLVCRILQGEGYEALSAPSAEEALPLLRQKFVDLVITDLRMPGKGGMWLMEQVRENWPSREVIVLSGHGDVATALEAMTKGAYDFLSKPVDDAMLRQAVRRALEHHSLVREVSEAYRRRKRRTSFHGMVGRSDVMQELYADIEAFAATGSDGLITGETGTGKELVTRALHALSDRKEGPLLALNCAALTETLLESELFGHVKGAFTGASASKRGIFEAASGGTLVLDEIEEASPRVQAALLRVLEERKIRPVGSTAEKDVDVRLFFITNKDLEDMIEEGSFRVDLYYRLLGTIIHVQPLRKRIEDIPLLVDHFLSEGVSPSSRQKRLSPRALEVLAHHPWPGNVRELKHLMQRVSALSAGDVIRPADLSRALGEKPRRQPFRTLDEVEREHLQQALQLSGGNKAQAARLLGIPRSSLYDLLQKHRLNLQDEYSPAS